MRFFSRTGKWGRSAKIKYRYRPVSTRHRYRYLFQCEFVGVAGIRNIVDIQRIAQTAASGAQEAEFVHVHGVLFHAGDTATPEAPSAGPLLLLPLFELGRLLEQLRAPRCPHRHHILVGDGRLSER